MAYWHDTVYTYPRKNSTTSKILFNSLSEENLLILFDNNQNMFDLSTVSNKDKVTLLLSDPKVFKQIIDTDKLPAQRRVELFIKKPAAFLSYLDFDKLAGTNLSRIARERPSYFKKHSMPVKNLTADAWERLIRHDSLYMNKFLDNIKHVRCKTRVRHMFEKYPAMIFLIEVDQAMDSVITAKEWVLLLQWDKIVRYGVKHSYDKMTYSDDMIEWLREELTIEMLRSSKQASRVLKIALEEL